VIDGKGTAGSQGGRRHGESDRHYEHVQNTTGVSNNFGELGRQLTTISIRDFFRRRRGITLTPPSILPATSCGTRQRLGWQGTTNAFLLQNSQSQSN